MKPLLGYLFLAIAISFGIASNSFAKISDGFTKLTPSILCILFMCITMFSIAKAMSALPVGFAYSTYSGLTVAGVVFCNVEIQSGTKFLWYRWNNFYYYWCSDG